MVRMNIFRNIIDSIKYRYNKGYILEMNAVDVLSWELDWYLNEKTLLCLNEECGNNSRKVVRYPSYSVIADTDKIKIMFLRKSDMMLFKLTFQK